MKRLIIPSILIPIAVVLLIGISTANAQRTNDPAAPAAPTFTVNSFNDAIAAAPLTNGMCETATGNGICTLRAAIMKANHYVGGGVTINLPAGTYVLTLPPIGPDDELTGDLNIIKNMALNGVSAASTIIDANQIDRVLKVETGVTVTLSNMTIRDGKSSGPGGIWNDQGTLTLNYSTISNNNSTNSGGGIYSNQGTLTLNYSTISNNNAQVAGGGIMNNQSTLALNHSTLSNNSAGSSGGGIYNLGAPLTVNNSTISNNSAQNDGGGIVNFQSTFTLTNSTISNNSARLTSGGIYNSAAGTLNAYYSTIVGNLADSDANASSAGGGIFNNGGAVNLKGTLLAQNYSAATPNDCQGTLTSQDYNLIQTTVGCTIVGATGNNLTGMADAFIDSLKDNGGSTPTRALFVGSPAINAIPTAQCVDQFAAPLMKDQRGFPRPVNGACDIGAYEGSLPMPIYNRNLIRNGDAEAMAGSPIGIKVGMPNWTQSYSGTLVPYGGSAGFPTATDPGPVDRGFGFFAGGQSAYTELTQTVSLSSIGAAIDAGKVHYDLSGYFGGYWTDNDEAELIAKFLNASHGFIFGPHIGAVYASDRSSQTGLLFRGTTGLVPAGTRFIELHLYMVIAAGSYNDGYADNLSLVLWPSKVFLPLVLK